MKGTLRIGTDSREIDQWSPSEINQAINRPHDDGQSICVQLHIQDGCADVRMSTPGCRSGGGGGRAPRPCEQELLDLWRKLHLDDKEFTGGNLVAFLQQAARIVS